MTDRTRFSEIAKKAARWVQENEVGYMDANDFIAIINRRRARFQAQRRSGPQEGMDETARLIAEEYDALLAEIDAALANQPEAQRLNNKAEAEILGDQGQSGG